MDQSIRPIDDTSASLMAPADLAAARRPFLEQMAETALIPLAPPPQFVLVLQDAIAEDGTTTIEVAGVQRPEAFDHTSPCHVVGAWVQLHIAEIVEAARSATVVAPQKLRLPDGSIIGART